MKRDEEFIRRVILHEISQKKTVAPRDIAVALLRESGDTDSIRNGDWRKLLPDIKQIAIQLHTEGDLIFWRKGKPASPKGLRGVYRFACPYKNNAIDKHNATDDEKSDSEDS